VVFGEGMVEKVGLYDERFYPLYFDDNDLERRVDQAGVTKNYIQAKVFHQNSSTLNSGYQAQNQKSYVANHTLFEIKGREDDFSQGEWSLKVRRANRWD
jgi:GT2 family glycosyltransferase